MRILLVLLILTGASTANASMRFSLFGAVSFPLAADQSVFVGPAAGDSITIQSRLTGGFGGFFEYGLGPLGLETGATYITLRTQADAQGNVATNEEVQSNAVLFIPLVARLHLGPISPGAGLYYAHPLTDAGVTQNGLVFSGRYSMMIFFGELRYHLGLKQVNDVAYSDLQLLLGFTF